MINLEPLRPGTVATKLAAFGRTDNPPRHIEEVEDFVFGTGPADVFRSGAGQVLLVSDGPTPVGVAIHRPHGNFNAELLSALLLDVAHRGRHLSEPVLRAVVDEAHRASGAAHVMWLVHEDNGPMLTISRRVSGEVGTVEPDGYLIFVHDA